MIPENMKQLIGRSFTFEDGNKITIREIKRGDENYHHVHYLTERGQGIPQQFVMEYVEFINTYGHLFP